MPGETQPGSIVKASVVWVADKASLAVFMRLRDFGDPHPMTIPLLVYLGLGQSVSLGPFAWNRTCSEFLPMPRCRLGLFVEVPRVAEGASCTFGTSILYSKLQYFGKHLM